MSVYFLCISDNAPKFGWRPTRRDSRFWQLTTKVSRMCKRCRNVNVFCHVVAFDQAGVEVWLKAFFSFVSKITFHYYLLLCGNLNKNLCFVYLFVYAASSSYSRGDKVGVLLCFLFWFAFPLIGIYRLCLYIWISHICYEIVEILNKSIISWLA